MCPSQLFFIVSLLLLSIINSSRANNYTCPSSVCNNGLNISYPFWRLDSYYNSASHQYCGYPGFGINCSQTDSILNISDELFNVTNTDCAQCEASDGRCGYNNSTQESLCFCKNGTVKSDDCNTKGTPF